jgi:hypothetical protein
MLFEDIGRAVKNGGEYFDKNFKKGEMWNIYGGHRMWKSPEDDASYVPDNYPIKYETDGGAATLFGNLQSNTRLQFKMSLEMKDDGALSVVHTIENKGAYTAELAVWAITVLAGGGVEIIPFNTNDTGFLPNNFFAFWPYDDPNDKRLSFDGGNVFLTQKPGAESPFKLGLLCKKGVAGYLNDGLLFIKKFPYQNGARYPDNNCNYETYTSGLILEMESLSPVFAVEPNGSVSHAEEFGLVLNVKDKEHAARLLREA